MQFQLRTLFHLVCLASAGSIAISGAIEGRPEKIAFPFMLLGLSYASIVAIRLRKTVVRFPWDVTQFVICWILFSIYVTAGVISLAGRVSRNFSSVSIIGDYMLMAGAPIVIWAVYRLIDIYRRAKLDGEDDYA
jgi:hypothetical protein